GGPAVGTSDPDASGISDARGPTGESTPPGTALATSVPASHSVSLKQTHSARQGYPRYTPDGETTLSSPPRCPAPPPVPPRAPPSPSPPRGPRLRPPATSPNPARRRAHPLQRPRAPAPPAAGPPSPHALARAKHLRSRAPATSAIHPRRRVHTL